ncbi:hypothetical protein PUR71_12680 [Streptomyces sp. SP17BM10]|nr:hypothetical protein [Streptomyces sp. SP17BM10]MEE1783756.1 hypothetical protein [Streptomyces sp. SP17BM10]
MFSADRQAARRAIFAYAPAPPWPPTVRIAVVVREDPAHPVP